MLDFTKQSTGHSEALRNLPSVNKCVVGSELKELHHKLVRFDCVITDMYEEELYVSILPSGGNTAKNKPLICKYFTDLTDE